MHSIPKSYFYVVALTEPKQPATHNFHKYLRESFAMTCTSAGRDKKRIDNKTRLYLPETTNTRKCTWREVATKKIIMK